MPDATERPRAGARARAARFCETYGLRVPIVMAPMAGACPASLAAAVANAGGMGGFGALTSSPEAITAWAREFRDGSNGGFQINLWIPDPPPVRDKAHEAAGARISWAMGSAGARRRRRRAAARFRARNATRCSRTRPGWSRRLWGSFPDKFVAACKAPASPGSPARRRWPRPAQPKPPAPTRSSRKAPRPAAIAARSTPTRRAAACRPVRAAASARRQPFAADYRRRRDRRFARHRRRADPRRQRGADRHWLCCAAPRPRPIPPGPTRWSSSSPKRRCRPAAFRDGSGAPWRPITSRRWLPLTRRSPRLTRYSAGSGRRCATRAPRRATSTGCRLGPARPRRFARAEPAADLVARLWQEAERPCPLLAFRRDFSRYSRCANEADYRQRRARGILRAPEGRGVHRRRHRVHARAHLLADLVPGAGRRAAKKRRRSTRWRPASISRRCSR